MRLAQNRVVARIADNQVAYGLYVMTPSPRLVEMLGAAGLDFVRIDLEAGAIGIETVQNMIYAAHAVGVTPFVRVAGVDEWQIETALKIGALGIIVPKVSDPRDVERVVSIAKTPPAGERLTGRIGPTGGYGSVTKEEFFHWSETNILLSVQIESQRGVDAVDEIARIEGLDMLHVGKADLANDLGVSGNQQHPNVLTAEERVLTTAIEAGKLAAIQYSPAKGPAHTDALRSWLARGVKCVSLGTDSEIVGMFRAVVEQARAHESGL